MIPLTVPVFPPNPAHKREHVALQLMTHLRNGGGISIKQQNTGDNNEFAILDVYCGADRQFTFSTEKLSTANQEEFLTALGFMLCEAVKRYNTAETTLVVLDEVPQKTPFVDHHAELSKVEKRWLAMKDSERHRIQMETQDRESLAVKKQQLAELEAKLRAQGLDPDKLKGLKSHNIIHHASSTVAGYYPICIYCKRVGDHLKLDGETCPGRNPKHLLYTPETCDHAHTDGGNCPVCDGGLGVCRVCGKAESELDDCPTCPGTSDYKLSKMKP